MTREAFVRTSRRDKRDPVLSSRTDHSPLTTDASIPSSLVALVSRMNRELTREAARLGLSLPGARLLALVSRRGEARCSTLAVALGIDAPTLSHVLRGLAERDLVTRNRARDDNRAVEVRLTPEGQALAARCRDIEALAQRRLLDGLAPSEVSGFSETLARLEQNLTRDGAHELA